MNTRERFLSAMNYKEPDRVPLWEFWGFEGETISRWHGEGLPIGMNIADYFNFDKRELISIDIRPIPRFIPRTVAEDERYRINVREDGAKVRVLKARPIIYEYLDFPVKNRADFERIKSRYDPRDPRRYPMTWSDELLDYYAGVDNPVGLNLIGFFRQGLYWMGIRNLLITFYKDPKLIHEMFSFWGDFLIETTQQAVEGAKIDYVCITEDIAYNKGPHISPELYREFILPYEKDVIDFMRKNGVNIVMVDCSGNIEQLVSVFIDAGYNCLTPVEAQAKMNVVDLRKKYGRRLRFIGNISLQALIKGEEAIEGEVKSKASLIDEGGFIPSVDDIVSSDISFSNYAYYINLLKKFL